MGRLQDSPRAQAAGVQGSIARSRSPILKQSAGAATLVPKERKPRDRKDPSVTAGAPRGDAAVEEASAISPSMVPRETVTAMSGNMLPALIALRKEVEAASAAAAADSNRLNLNA